MQIACDKDQTQYCDKRMTLFGFQSDQLNLKTSCNLQETLNPKVKVLSHLSPLSFPNINVTVFKCG